MRKILLTLTLITITILALSCINGASPTTPTDTQDFRIAASRWNPANTSIEAVNITVVRTQDGALELPGRDITMTASSGNVSGLTDHGDGTYDAIWTGAPDGEVTVVATDNGDDPPLQTSITFLALEYLDPEWEVPIKLAAPVSTDGWETASFLYPSGNNLAFAYITLDWVALAANIIRPIGEERPDQSIPQTLNIYIAERPAGVNPQWWTGWTVNNAQVNHFQSLPMYLSAPMVTSDNSMAFCTIQEFNGLGYDPTTIYSLDAGFINAPTALGPPVDMTGLGEDNPYYDVMQGWLYFDTYDLGDPLSKQNIWAAQSLGAGSFDTPVPLTDLNTPNIETQSFIDEHNGMIYFATDRDRDDYLLAIWRATIFGTYTGVPEQFAAGSVAIGRPSFSQDGQWFCFTYATIDPHGSDANIAMCRRVE
jgi:hypothetical protein